MTCRRVVVVDVSRRRRRRPSPVKWSSELKPVVIVGSPSAPLPENSCHPRTPPSTPPEGQSWKPLIQNSVAPLSSARRRRWLRPTAVSVSGVAAVLVVGGVVRWSVITARGEGVACARKEEKLKEG